MATTLYGFKKSGQDVTDITPKAASGGIVQKIASGTSSALSGQFSILTLSIPSGANIRACQLRVDTAITGATNWTALFSGGNTDVICAHQALDKNTKVNVFCGGPATDTTNIAILKEGSDFTAGVISAIVYYEELTTMASV